MKKYILEIYKPGKTIKIKNTLVRTPVKYIIDENDKKGIETLLKNIYGFDKKDYKITEIKRNTKNNNNNNKKIFSIINKKEKIETIHQNEIIEENKNKIEENIEENKLEINKKENNINQQPNENKLDIK